ncbi:sulfotransferase domain-containing protein [candidate division KSB1 bacterium]
MENITLISQPRSGYHWLLAVLMHNIPRGLSVTPKSHNEQYNASDKFVYVYRKDIEASVASLHNVRSFFGLDIDDYNTFKNTRMRDMFNANMPVTVVTDGIDIEHIDPMFRDETKTPVEFMNASQAYWFGYGSTANVHLVCYEDMVSDLQGTMDTLFDFMNIPRQTIIDVPTRVGITETMS